MENSKDFPTNYQLPINNIKPYYMGCRFGIWEEKKKNNDYIYCNKKPIER